MIYIDNSVTILIDATLMLAQNEYLKSYSYFFRVTITSLLN